MATKIKCNSCHKPAEILLRRVSKSTVSKVTVGNGQIWNGQSRVSPLAWAQYECSRCSAELHFDNGECVSSDQDLVRFIEENGA